MHKYIIRHNYRQKDKQQHMVNNAVSVNCHYKSLQGEEEKKTTMKIAKTKKNINKDEDGYCRERGGGGDDFVVAAAVVVEKNA